MLRYETLDREESETMVYIDGHPELWVECFEDGWAEDRWGIYDHTNRQPFDTYTLRELRDYDAVDVVNQWLRDRGDTSQIESVPCRLTYCEEALMLEGGEQ